MTRLLLAIPAVALLASGAAARPTDHAVPVATAAPITPLPAPRVKPSLVILISVDQFKAEYLDKFGAQLTGGLARLAKGGARFTNAHHDHAITETAPGHATLLSGRFPRSTGIMLNREGVDDNAYPLVQGGYGSGASPRRFQGTTLADWMKAADKNTKTLSVSMKDRGAILPIGTSKSDVYWYAIDGRFLTSTYYRKDIPAWLQQFNERNLVFGYAGKTWDLLLPASEYAEPDSVPAEMGGKQFTFPHRLSADPIDAGSEIRITPFMDELVLALALHGLQSMKLGTGSSTDLLSMSLSATDVIGHNYGPDSREMHDQVLRLDRALGRFLDSLYTLRDSTTVTVVLTADHGVGSIPELRSDVTPTPVRADLYPLMPAVRAQLKALKVDTFAVELDQQILLANRKAFKKPADLDSVVDAFARAARTRPGIARVDRWSTILADSGSDDIARRWAHQFPADANIAAVVTLTPYSTWGGNVASHGSPRDYDSHVPIIFFGAGVTPGVHAEQVRTVDIAPTLAALLGVKPLERLDGTALPIHP
jgi:predicted AlkP superfamily pyrophosphatase or phosphodiesterase